MDSSSGIEKKTDDLVAYLNGLAWLSQTVWGPTRELCDEMTSPVFWDELTVFSLLLNETGRGAIRRILDCFQNASSPENLFDRLETDYIRLFVSAPGGVKAPLYHSFYDSPEKLLMRRPAAMMEHRLQTAGFSSDMRPSELPDHLAVELEYLYFLLEAGLERDNPDLIREAASFITTEMLPWVREWSRLTIESSLEPFYADTSLLVVSSLEWAADLNE